MKICPICNTEYNDEINFCKQDGTKLVDNAKKNCPKCGKTYPSDFDFCMVCGTKLFSANSKPTCPNCGIELPKGAAFCVKCGTKVEVWQNVFRDFVLVEGNETVKDFYICKYEVTQKLYESVMGKNPSHFKGDDRPVESVSWYDAVEFCNKLSEKEGLTPCYSKNGKETYCDFIANGYRLPTEAEWVFAAKGGNKSKGYTYAGSNNIGEVAWYAGKKSNKETYLVGQKKENELGLFDMSGNVWEWCWDSYNDNHYYHGGSWYCSADDCEVSGKKYYASGQDNDLGFRLVRTAK